MRDVADLHVRAMTHPAAKGERFIPMGGKSMSMLEIAKVLRARMGKAGRRVPGCNCPIGWYGWRRSEIRRCSLCCRCSARLVRAASHEKAARLLGWSRRSNEETIVATAESLVKFGLVKG